MKLPLSILPVSKLSHKKQGDNNCKARLEVLEERSLLTLTLPDFAGYEEGPASVALPGWFDVFDPMEIDDELETDPGAPVFAEWTTSAGPDDTLVISGDQFTLLAGSAAGADTQFWVYGQTTAGNFTSLQAEVKDLNGDNEVILTLPESLVSGSMYLLWAQNDAGIGRPVAINRTDVWWLGSDATAAGERISFYGSNLTNDNFDWDVDDGGSAPAAVWIETLEGEDGFWATVTDANPYRVEFELPKTLAEGEYRAWIHNGQGGKYGWGAPQTFTVRSALSNGTGWDNEDISEISITAIGGGGNIELTSGNAGAASANAAALQAAFDYAAALGHAKITIGAGHFYFDASLVVSSNVQIVGASHIDSSGEIVIDTILEASGGSGFDFASGTNTGVLIVRDASNVEIADLSLTNGDTLVSGKYQGGVGSLKTYANPLVLVHGSADIRLRNVLLDSRSNYALYVLDSERFWLTDSEVITNATRIEGCEQVFITGNTYKLTNQSEHAVNVVRGDLVDVSNNLVRNLDPLSATTADRGLRFFWGAHGGRYQYIAKNQTENLGFLPGTEANKGEQIAWEINLSELDEIVATVSGAGGTTLTFENVPEYVVEDLTDDGQIYAVITAGTGIGQARALTGVPSWTPAGGGPRGTLTVTLASDWNVAPVAGESRISLVNLVHRGAIFKNLLDGTATDVTTSTHNASSGVELFSGNYGFFVDSNNIQQVRYGITLWAMARASDRAIDEDSLRTVNTIDTSMFNVVANNTVQEYRTGIALFSGNTTPAATDTGEGGDTHFGTVIRRNTLNDVPDSLAPSDKARGIAVIYAVSQDYIAPRNRLGDVVIEHNNVTDTPVGIDLDIVGRVMNETGVNYSSSLVTDLFFYKNHFTGRGSTPETGSAGMRMAGGQSPILDSNNFSNYDEEASGLPPVTGALVVAYTGTASGIHSFDVMVIASDLFYGADSVTYSLSWTGSASGTSSGSNYRGFHTATIGSSTDFSVEYTVSVIRDGVTYSYTALQDIVVADQGLTIRGSARADTVILDEDGSGFHLSVLKVGGIDLRHAVTLSYSSISEIYIDGDDGPDWIDASGVDTIGITLYGGGYSDTLVGGASGDTLDGFGPDTLPGAKDSSDSLIGGGGDDSLFGYTGSDTLIGGEGDDSLNGGSGKDFYTYLGATSEGDDTVTDSTSNEADFLDLSRYATMTGLTVDLSASTISLPLSTTIYHGSYLEGVIGTALDDTLIGGPGRGYLVGGDGDDSILGSDQADYGDTIYGGFGDDTIRGRDGKDYITGGFGADSLNGGTGNDQLIGGRDSDTLDGGEGIDVLDAGVNASDGVNYYAFSRSSASVDLGLDLIVVSAGNGAEEQSFDFLDLSGFTTTSGTTVNLEGIVSGSYTYVVNESGNLQIQIFTSLPKVSAAISVFYDDQSGPRTGASAVYFDGVIGTDQDDTIVGNLRRNSLLGGGGNDSINGKGNHDWLDGGSGEDTLNGDTSNDTLVGGSGDDSLFGGANSDTFIFSGASSFGTDSISDGSNTDQLDFSGLSDSISINLGTGGFSSSGGQLSLNLSGSSFRKVIGTDGNDSLTGSGSSDTLEGGKGNDTIDGSFGADTYVFRGTGLGTDELTDGGGTDTLDFTSFGGAITVDLSASGIQTIHATYLTLDFTGTSFENVLGSAFTDTLIGNTSNNELAGNEGNDSLSGGAGHDTYSFSGADGLGDDTITDSSGTDWLDFAGLTAAVSVNLSTSTLSSSLLQLTFSGAAFEGVAGGDGDDLLIGNSTSGTLLGGNGNDSLVGGSAADTLNGGSGNDSLLGMGGNDSLLGGGGDDSLIGGTENDTLTGESGEDQYLFDGNVDLGSDHIVDDLLADEDGNILDFRSFDVGNGVSFSLGSISAQTLVSGKLAIQLNDTDAISAIIGTIYGDTLVGNAGDNYFAPLEGNDSVDGGAGNDLYLFSGQSTQGTDTITDSSGVDALFFGDSGILTPFSATISLNLATSVLSSSLLSLNFVGTDFEQVHGTENDDTIIGTSGADVLVGGAGNDYLDGGAGDNLLFGSDGNDTIIGGSDVDLVSGGAGNDSVLGGDDDDLVLGGSGNDTLDGQDGNDFLNAGKDNDNLIGGADNDTLLAGTGNDALQGDAGADYLFGNAGVDSLNGGAGNDSIWGGSGNDTYYFVGTSLGSDRLNDENGAADTLDFADFTSAIDFSTGLTTGQSIGGSTTVQLTSGGAFENVVGTNNADQITGNSLDNRLDGGGGDDTLLGVTGNDTLLGGADDDSLLGGDHNDSLMGGIGNDTLAGGASSDFYVYGGSSNLGSDVIDDSSSGDDDANLLDLYAFDSGSGATVDLSITSAQTLVSSFLSLQLMDATAITQVLGTIYGDVLIGNSAANILAGMGGNDSLVGGAGDDLYLFAGDDDLGTDTLSDSGGGDALYFGDTDFFPTYSADLSIDLSLTTLQTVTTGKLSLLLTSADFEVVIGGLGDDTILGTSNAEIIFGGVGADSIDGSGGDDLIGGDAGDDSILGGDGYDSIGGDDGNDFLNGGDDEDLILGGGGADVVFGGDGDDIVTGGLGFDSLLADAGDDSLIGGDGVDLYVFAGSNLGSNVIWDTTDRDVLVFNDLSSGVTIDLSDDQTSQNIDGSSYIRLFDASWIYWVVGSSSADNITGNFLDNIMLGGGGNDSLAGGIGNDAILGGDGNDRLDAEEGDDLLFGEAGDDVLFGRDGDDILDGGTGADTMWGGNNNDTVYGAENGDSLRGGGGDDLFLVQTPASGSISVNGDGSGLDSDSLTILGGTGDDSWTLISSGAQCGGTFLQITDIEHTTIDLSSNASDGDLLWVEGTSGADTLAVNGAVLTGTDIGPVELIGIETVVISGMGNSDLIDVSLSSLDARLVLLGDGGDDTMIGSDGNDVLAGGDGADSLVGNDGDDILISGLLDFNDPYQALRDVTVEWTGSHLYADRRLNILGTGSNPIASDSQIDPGVTATDVGTEVDTLYGGDGDDWFLLDLADDVVDAVMGELEDDIT